MIIISLLFKTGFTIMYPSLNNIVIFTYLKNLWNGIILYIFFVSCSCYSILFLRVIHAIICNSSSLIFIAVCVNTPEFIHPSVDWHMCYLQFGVIVNETVMNSLFAAMIWLCLCIFANVITHRLYDCEQKISKKI